MPLYRILYNDRGSNLLIFGENPSRDVLAVDIRLDRDEFSALSSWKIQHFLNALAASYWLYRVPIDYKQSTVCPVWSAHELRPRFALLIFRQKCRISTSTVCAIFSTLHRFLDVYIVHIFLLYCRWARKRVLLRDLGSETVGCLGKTAAADGSEQRKIAACYLFYGL